MKDLRVWANRNSATGGIFLGVDDYSERDPRTAKPLKFKTTRLYETDDKTAMCTISCEAATKLMDDLWELGIRPLDST